MMLGIGLLAVASTLTIGDRTEVRARTTSGNIAGSDQEADLETDPEIRLKVRGNHDDDEFQLYYTPRLILSHMAYDLCGPSTTATSCGLLPNIGASYTDSPTPEILNGGGLSFKHAHGRTAIAFIEQATYGTVDAGSLLAQPLWVGTDAPPPVFPIPKYPDIQLELVTSYGGVSFYEQVTPRIDFQANASFGVYGGPNNESRATFPLTESPGLQLKLEDSVTRTNDFIVSAGADYTGVTTYVGPQPGFVPGPHTPLDVAPASPQYSVRGYVEARVRHRWTRRSSTELALGGVVAYQEEQLDVTRPSVTSLTTPYPMAEMITIVGASPNPPPPQATTSARSQLFVVARAQPWIDIFDGTVVERAEGILGWIGVTGQNTFRADVVGQYVIPTDSSPGRYRFLYGELDYIRSLGQSLSVDFGVRGGAESTSESEAACVTTTSACASPTAIPAVSQSMYEGELILGFSWKPNAVKL
jgi:hypothetical protein